MLLLFPNFADHAAFELPSKRTKKRTPPAIAVVLRMPLILVLQCTVLTPFPRHSLTGKVDESFYCPVSRSFHHRLLWIRKSRFPLCELEYDHISGTSVVERRRPATTAECWVLWRFYWFSTVILGLPLRLRGLQVGGTILLLRLTMASAVRLANSVRFRTVLVYLYQAVG
ncbi:hypothetical protein ARMGADRAFT_623851 [Armillaria gallica]|uniref:Uncharacterized protein n=1 Tax=Armillaria gallica TaxID=47427 RepID=A0A2H3D4J4_ARMGA|nr:hypothetical protein ARMGADRAFT_623851 [Armillaria gallica]